MFILIIRTPSNPQLVKELAQRIQADDLIPKPCSVEDVLAKANEWLDAPHRPAPIYERDLQGGVRPSKIVDEKSLPMRGRFTNVSFASLLQQLLHAKFEGLLELTDKRKKLRISFQGGQPVYVQSNYIREDSLGKILLDDNKVSQEQLDRALEMAANRKMRLGQALLELNLLTEPALEKYLREQHLLKLLGTFEPRWQQGEFILLPGPISTKSRSWADISTVALIQEGIRRNSPLKDLLPIFQRKNRLKRVLRATPELDAVFGQMKLDNNLIRVTDLLRRGMKIPDLEVLVQIDREVLFQFLYTLLTLRAARFEGSVAAENEQAIEDLAAFAGDGDHEAEPPKAESAVDYNRDFYIGKTYFDRGDFEKALQHLQAAVRFRPDSVECLSMIGWATFVSRPRHDRFATEQAKELCKQAITRSPNHAKAHLYLAKIARAEKNDKLADSYAIKAHQCDPDDPEISHEYELALIRRRNK